MSMSGSLSNSLRKLTISWRRFMKRRQDIVNFLKELDKDPDIDMVGLDYVRTGTAGYEMVDEFVKDLNVPGPANFWSLSKQERIHWLAKTVEQKEDPQVV